MTIAFYISGHGLGHASRVIEVINAVHRKRSSTRIIVRTSAQRWFFDTFVRAPIEFHEGEVDTGVTQIDGLRLDEIETARRARDFYGYFDERVARERDLLAASEASVVVADIPPLPFAAAARLGVPSIALGNFTWDWIYAGYRDFEDGAPNVVALIGEAYSNATRTLRLPFHGGFQTMGARLVDIPLVARKASRSREEIRNLLGIGREAPVVLASFGGYGVRLPFAEIARTNRFTLVVTDHELKMQEPPAAHGIPPSGDGSTADGRLVCVQVDALARRGIYYPDLVGAADVVVSKPGYGIVSECIANGTALLYTDRGRFAEHDVFVAEMPKVLRCRFIPQDDLLAGRWREAVFALLRQPAPPQSLDTNGAEIAAETILST